MAQGRNTRPGFDTLIRRLKYQQVKIPSDLPTLTPIPRSEAKSIAFQWPAAFEQPILPRGMFTAREQVAMILKMTVGDLPKDLQNEAKRGGEPSKRIMRFDANRFCIRCGHPEEDHARVGELEYKCRACPCQFQTSRPDQTFTPTGRTP